jgi:hypothetical protein
MSRRYVARGITGGYRIWNNKSNKWWGELYEFCPDDLLEELNGEKRPDKIVELQREAKKAKR